MAQQERQCLGSARMQVRSPAPWAEDPALPQLRLRLQLRLRSDPWPRTHMPRGGRKKKAGGNKRVLLVKDTHEKLFEERCSVVLACGSACSEPTIPSSGSGALILL